MLVGTGLAQEDVRCIRFISHDRDGDLHISGLLIVESDLVGGDGVICLGGAVDGHTGGNIKSAGGHLEALGEVIAGDFGGVIGIEFEPGIAGDAFVGDGHVRFAAGSNAASDGVEIGSEIGQLPFADQTTAGSRRRGRGIQGAQCCCVGSAAGGQGEGEQDQASHPIQ